MITGCSHTHLTGQFTGYQLHINGRILEAGEIAEKLEGFCISLTDYVCARVTIEDVLNEERIIGLLGSGSDQRCGSSIIVNDS